MSAQPFALRSRPLPSSLRGPWAAGGGPKVGVRVLWLALLALAGACDGPRPAHDLFAPVPELLTRVGEVAEHESCPSGATVAESGFDWDEDGELGEEEVSSTEILCSDEPDPCVLEEGETFVVIRCPGQEPLEVEREAPGGEPWLVLITAGAPEQHCPAGGFTVERGRDGGDRDGVLDEDEIETTDYLCHPYCGDEAVDAALGEECDDGNADAGDGCDEACRVEPSCMPPEPDPACPPSGYHVELTVPSAISTAGGSLTLHGAFPEDADLEDAVVVLQGTETLLEVTALSATQLALEVPPGVGFFALEVSVAGWPIPFWAKTMGLDGVWSVDEQDVVSLRYSTPLVTSVSGCVDVGSATKDCAAAGGSILTVTGSQFGTDPGRIGVLVGGVPCASVVVSVPHTTLQCELAPRSGGAFDLTVAVEVADQTSFPIPAVSYEGPAIVDESLRVNGGSAQAEADLPDTGGGHLITFLAKGLDGVDVEDVQVEFQTGDYRIACTDPVVTPASEGLSQVDCDIAPGVGQGLAPVLIAEGLSSRPGADRLHHPLPVLQPGTLRTDPLGVGTDELLGSRSGGEEIHFDASHLGEDPSALRVTYGTSEDPERYGCGNLDIDGPTLRCTTAFGSGGPYELTVHLPGGASVRGTDSYTYPVGPRITAVSGCFDMESTTVECPTAGGVTLAITGEGFGADVWVHVGGVPCDDLQRLGPTSLTCTLPAGVGAVDVVAGEGLLRSEGFTIGYGGPVITRVSGCALQSGNTTGACTAGVQIEIEGQHFGASGATVLVGDGVCTAVQHHPGAPHQRLHCTLPPGSGTRPVYVVNGHVSESFVIHYTLAE